MYLFFLGLGKGEESQRISYLLCLVSDLDYNIGFSHTLTIPENKSLILFSFWENPKPSLQLLYGKMQYKDIVFSVASCHTYKCTVWLSFFPKTCSLHSLTLTQKAGEPKRNREAQVAEQNCILIILFTVGTSYHTWSLKSSKQYSQLNMYVQRY